MVISCWLKFNRVVIVAFSLLVAFACNNHPSKEIKNDSSAVSKPVSEKSIIKETGKSEQKAFKTCDSIAKEILTTSPRYKKLTEVLYKAIIKNGGQSFGVRLEGSPNPQQDKIWSYSENYDFAVYEVYTDRELNIARFSYNPNKKRLYEYDEVSNLLIPIESDTNLILKYDECCK